MIKKPAFIASLFLGSSIVLASFIISLIWTSVVPELEKRAESHGWTLEIDEASRAMARMPGSRNGWFFEGLRLSRFAAIRIPLEFSPTSILLQAEIEGSDKPAFLEEIDNYEGSGRQYVSDAVLKWGVNETDAWYFVLSPVPGETGIFLTRRGFTRQLGTVREFAIPDRENLRLEVEISPSHIVARVEGHEVARSSGYGVSQGDVALGSFVRECLYKSFSVQYFQDTERTTISTGFSPWLRLVTLWASAALLGAVYSFAILMLSGTPERIFSMAYALAAAHLSSLLLLVPGPSIEARIITALLSAAIAWWLVILAFRHNFRQKPSSWKSSSLYYHIFVLSATLVVGAFTPRPFSYAIAVLLCTLYSMALHYTGLRWSILKKPPETDLILIAPLIFYSATWIYSPFPSDFAIMLILAIFSIKGLMRTILNDVHIQAYNWHCLIWFVLSLFFVEISLQLSPLPHGSWRDRAGRTEIGAVFWTPAEDGNIEFRRGYFERQKPESTRRIISLGGSSTLGWPIRDDSAPYPAQLERIFNENQLDMQVLNAGVGGYTSFQGLLFLEEELLSWEPDIITFCFGANDGNNNLEVGIGISDREYWEARQRIAEYPLLLKLTELTGKMFIPGLYRRLLFSWFPPKPTKRVPLEDFYDNLNRFVDLSENYNFVPVLMFEPEHRLRSLSTALDKNPYYRALVEISLSRDVLLVDTVAALQTPHRDQYFMDNVHLSSEGHERIAYAIFRALRNKILPELLIKPE